MSIGIFLAFTISVPVGVSSCHLHARIYKSCPHTRNYVQPHNCQNFTTHIRNCQNIRATYDYMIVIIFAISTCLFHIIYNTHYTQIDSAQHTYIHMYINTFTVTIQTSRITSSTFTILEDEYYIDT